MGVNARHPDTPKSITRNLRNLPLNNAARTCYQYNNIMYTVATHLLETRTGTPFDSFLQNEVFDKLDMTSTFLQPSAVHAVGQSPRLSTPYYWKHGSYHIAARQEVPEAQGAGSIQTSVVDYAKLLRAIFQRTHPISEAIYTAITTPRTMHNSESLLQELGPDSRESAYALGWDVRYVRGKRVISHSGVITGYGSRVLMVPDYDFAAILVGNCRTAFDLTAVVEADMLNELLSVPLTDRFDKSIPRLKKVRNMQQRREKNEVRNAQRIAQARGTTSLQLSAYTGTFYNVGYKAVTIEVKDGDLILDGSERSSPFTIVLEHIRDDVEFRGYLNADDELGDEIIPLRFEIDNNKAHAVGIVFEPALGADHYLWFKRV